MPPNPSSNNESTFQESYFTVLSEASTPTLAGRHPIHMHPSNGSDHPPPHTSRVHIDEEGSQQILKNSYAHLQPSKLTDSTTKPPEDLPPRSNSREFTDDSRSLTTRYRKALGLQDTLDSSTSSMKHEDIDTNRHLVSVGTEVFSSTDDDGFDWDESDESELDEVEREERRNRKLRAQHVHLENENHFRHAKRLRKVYLSFSRLSKPIRIALFLLVGVGIAITPTIIALVCYPGTPVKNHIMIWSIWASVNIALSCLIPTLVDIFPSLVIKLSYFLYGSVPEKLKTQIELWMGVRTWTKIALSLTGYWVALLVMFSPVFPFQADPQLDYFTWITRVAGVGFGSGLVLLIEKVLLQIVMINFHKTSLKDRLEQNEKALWALDKLAAAKDASKAPRKQTQFSFSPFTPGARSAVATGRNTPAHMTGTQTPLTGNKTSRPIDTTVVDVPMAPMLPHTVSSDLAVPEGVSAAQLTKQLQAEAQKKQTLYHNLSNITGHFTHAIASVALKNGNLRDENGFGSSTHSAKKLARKLFEGLDEDQGGVLTQDEFEPYFKNRADAIEAFKLFDKDGNGDIDRKEMRIAVARIYRERKALATSLKDMSSAVSKLDGVLLGIAFLIIIFIWLFVFNPKGTTAQLVPMATIILGFSFVFGNAAKNLFESMLFIFSIHPYDVGDLVFIDDTAMFVLEFGLFCTTFQRTDGQVIVAPNSVLFSKKYIINVRRSGPMWETTKIMVGFSTPLDVLHEFRSRLRQYVLDHPRDWKGGLDVNIDFMQNQNLIQLVVAMEHKHNWQDWGARWDRRTLLMKEMKKIMDGLNMSYKLPIQPISFIPHRSTRRGYESLSSNLQQRGQILKSPISPTSTFPGNAARIGTNAQMQWNTGNLPSLGIQPNRP